MKYIFVIVLLLFTSLPSFSQGPGRTDTSTIARNLKNVLESCRYGRDEADCLRYGIREVLRDISYSNNPSQMCVGVDYYGKWADGGGCNYYGCWYRGGGCDYYGCWYEGGSCNYYGCIREAPKTQKACRD